MDKPKILIKESGDVGYKKLGTNWNRKWLDDSDGMFKELYDDTSKLSTDIEEAKNNPNLKDGSVTNPIIKNGAVTEDKVQDEAIGSSKLKKESVTEEIVAPNSITNSKLRNEVVSPDKTTFLKSGKNMFDKNAIEQGFYIDQTGKKYSSSLHFYSTNINVNAKETYVANVQNDGLFVNFYDKDYKRISGIVANYDSQARYFETPENCASIIVSGKTRHVDTLQIEFGNAITSYEEYYTLGINLYAQDKRADKIEQYEFSRNLVSDDWIIGEAYNENTGVPINVGSLKRVVPFDVEPSTFYTLSGVNLTGINIAEFKTDGTFTGIKGASSNPYTFTTKASTGSIGVVVNKAAEQVQLELGKVATKYQTAHTIKELRVPYLENEIEQIKKNEEETKDENVWNPSDTKFTLNTSLSSVAPVFYSKLKSLSEDLVFMTLGDSLLVSSQDYQSKRSDAQFRPPLCEENSFISFIEETIRPAGQEYFRYDSGIFTEVADTKETKSYDSAWDWQATSSASSSKLNNRPALTRVLIGSSASISYAIPKKAFRCDYIYRTDSTNADTIKVTISKGNGVITVFDEAQSKWIEANNYTFSQKESASLITGGKGTIKKSIYQKRLKMKFVDAVQNDGTTTVKLTNQSNARLTYWGIQTSPNEYMLDVINANRGGHKISELKPFEAWDVDGFKPNLMMLENPIINEGTYIADANNNPLNLTKTDEAYANLFKDWTVNFKEKAYKPEVLNFTVFFNSDAMVISKTENKINCANVGNKRTTLFKRLDLIASKIDETDGVYLPIFESYWNEIKRKAQLENNVWYEAVFNKSTGLTVDTAHLNDNGALLLFNITRNFWVN